MTTATLPTTEAGVYRLDDLRAGDVFVFVPHPGAEASPRRFVKGPGQTFIPLDMLLTDWWGTYTEDKLRVRRA